jgi:hypothetical protein
MNSIQNDPNKIEDGNKILDSLDNIVKETHEQLEHNARLLEKRGIRIPIYIRTEITKDLKSIISCNTTYNIINTIYLNGPKIKSIISEIIDIYKSRKNNNQNGQITYIYAPQREQLLSGDPTITENLILIPIKSSDDTIKYYIKFLISHGILACTNGIKNLEISKKIKEYITYVLADLLYHSTFSTTFKLNRGNFIILYNTMGCEKILKSASSLISKDSFTLGTCTGYDLLINKYSYNRINLKEIYRTLTNDPYYFLKNTQNNTNNTFL